MSTASKIFFSIRKFYPKPIIKDKPPVSLKIKEKGSETHKLTPFHLHPHYCTLN